MVVVNLQCLNGVTKLDFGLWNLKFKIWKIKKLSVCPQTFLSNRLVIINHDLCRTRFGDLIVLGTIWQIKLHPKILQAFSSLIVTEFDIDGNRFLTWGKCYRHIYGYVVTSRERLATFPHVINCSDICKRRNVVRKDIQKPKGKNH